VTPALQRRGSGEPLVLLHGIGMSGNAWAPVAERVASEREVISVDMPGFGSSAGDPLPDPPSISNFAAALKRVFDEQGIERPHVAGNSMGGGVALELGRIGAVRSVTVFSPVGFNDAVSKIWEEAVLRGAYRGAKLGERMNPPGGATGWRLGLTRSASFLTAYGRPFAVPAEALRSAAAELAGADGFLDSLPYVRGYRFEDAEELRDVPVTVAWGRRDVLLNWRIQSRRARRALPWARHVDLPRCGHVPFYDDPNLCAEVLIEGTRG
jgi:pimeloyl-ACP methyl ester carboxylesterase